MDLDRRIIQATPSAALMKARTNTTPKLAKAIALPLYQNEYRQSPFRVPALRSQKDKTLEDRLLPSSSSWSSRCQV
jgi:hypothetical protein